MPSKPSNTSAVDSQVRISDTELFAGAESWLQRVTAGGETFDAAIFQKCHVVSASMKPVPTITFELEVVPMLGNGNGTFHGGAITTAFDNLTTCPLFLTARDGIFQLAGVSRSLNVSFLRPAPIGTILLVECAVLNMGKRLALIRGEMRRKSDDALVAICMHDKANTDPGGNVRL